MKIQGAHHLAAPPAQIFDRLMEPAVLQQAIPGCEKMEKVGDDEYVAHLRLGIGSIKGSYAGKVRLADREPPHKFTMHVAGSGGPGFVKGTCGIELKAEDQGTKLHFSADVQVGGLIAAVGSRVIEAAAKKLAGEFFRKFGAIVEHPAKS